MYVLTLGPVFYLVSVVRPWGHTRKDQCEGREEVLQSDSNEIPFTEEKKGSTKMVKIYIGFVLCQTKNLTYTHFAITLCNKSQKKNEFYKHSK